MTILLLINSVIFMFCSSIFWFFGTAFWMGWSFISSMIIYFNASIKQSGFELVDILGAFLFSISQSLPKYNDLFILFWNFGNDKPLFALIISVILGGMSTRAT